MRELSESSILWKLERRIPIFSSPNFYLLYDFLLYDHFRAIDLWRKFFRSSILRITKGESSKILQPNSHVYSFLLPPLCSFMSHSYSKKYFQTVNLVDRGRQKVKLYTTKFRFHWANLIPRIGMLVKTIYFFLIVFLHIHHLSSERGPMLNI